MKKLIGNIVAVCAFALVLTTTGEIHMADAQQSEAASPSSLMETYGDWVVRCVADEVSGSGRICEMTQELLQQDNGQRILAVSFRPTPEGANMTLIAPFGLDLAAGLRVGVADDHLLDMVFQTCLPTGCIAIDAVNVDQVELFKSGENATIVVLNMEGQEVALNVSLTGFTAAWNRLSGF